MMKNGFLILLFIIPSALVQAQNIMSAEEAVSIALKNNYDILVAKNSAESAKINNTAGNAGMLPGVAVTASDNYYLNNVNQTYSSGSEINAKGSGANSFNSGVELNWTLFDGGKMFVTKNRLSEIEKLGEIQFRDQVLQTAYNVIVAYYDVVRQKQQLAYIEEVISSYKTTVNILQTSFRAGLSPKTNLLQAQIDLNVYMENEINQKVVIIASKRSLNLLLSRDPDYAVEVADSIPLNYVPDRVELSQKLFSNNTQVISLQKQVDIARLGLKETRTIQLPKISFSSGYNYLKSNSSAGTVLMNQTYGPQVGGTISIPIYQSGNASRQIEEAKLQLQSAQYSLESIKLQVNNELQNVLTDFENQQELLKIEKNNLSLSKENLLITTDRLRLGQTTSLELHQAQQSYVESFTRMINFEYNLKVAETKLKQLLSELH